MMVSNMLEVADFEEANELFHKHGWTDGLPIIPPTSRKLAQFLEVVGRTSDEELGIYSMRNRPVTTGKVAVNAIMAGCLPEYLPVVIALVECMLEPDFNIHVANSSTGSLAMGYIVNGPIRHALRMNCHGDVLGPGNRANSSIGRAIRLIQINIMGSISGAGAFHAHGLPVLDRSTMGQPAKYACYHVAENEEDFPQLAPLHTQRGFAPSDNVVTAFLTGGHMMFSNHAEHSPEQWLDTLAHYLIGMGRLADDGFGVLLLPPEAAGMFVSAGWSKADIAQGLFERTRRSLAWNKRNGWKVGGRFERGGTMMPCDEDIELGVFGSPDQLLIAICGAPAGNFPVFLYTYGSTFPVCSRRILYRFQGDHGPVLDRSELLKALEPLRLMLKTDGYLLQVPHADNSTLCIQIEAEDGTCAECLVPKPMMERHIRAALGRKEEWKSLAIELLYPADQNENGK